MKFVAPTMAFLSLAASPLVLAAASSVMLIAPALADGGIAPADAGLHDGQTITIEGVAHVYTAKSGMTFIDMGGQGKTAPFSAVVMPTDAAHFANLANYNGHVVDVTGTIQMYQGKPEMILKTDNQLVLAKPQ